ncbi:XRE family transcriptional regulator [Amylibacter kogurei]|uniref:XRE family transcriptional regulator n=1 Tax=Paramylibacter kogurei TaxID=1889778 RepID=A0A2G5K1V2_9RHOB|nr:XRE family transcriptional regulator [Amylibacter kogurei]PIB22880.1 XRE family transcriptional regulator [Amylibacter kogurei]
MSDTLQKFPTSLGADLRALRKSRGITLAQMAEKTQRSVGWVSQIERDLSEPSITDLRKLSHILGVSISLFFGQSDMKENEKGRIVRASARRQIGGGDAGLIEELLSPDLTDDFEMVRSVFQPNAKLSEFVTRDTQEVGYLISGRLTLWLGDEKFDLEAGDSFRIRAERFKWENPHSETAVAIWVIAPPVY